MINSARTSPETWLGRWNPVSRWFVCAGLLFLSLGLSGCVQTYIAGQVVRAPNTRGNFDAYNFDPEFQAYLNEYAFPVRFKVPVEPHPADIAVAVLEPGDYQFEYVGAVTNAEQTRGGSTFNVTFPDPDLPRPPAKGTIVLLHGFGFSKTAMYHWAFHLAEAEYRVVLVDLRGHGESTGETITFGAWEKYDLVQVLDELTRRDLVAGKVGVLGISYGGSVAIQWAAVDPRIAALIALAPFAEVREAIDELTRAAGPKVLGLVREKTLRGAIDEAPDGRGFSWDEADTLAAAEDLQIPVLLFHGSDDTWVPMSHSERISKVAPPGSRLQVEPGNHVTISVLLDPMAEQVDEWFERYLGSDPAAP